MFEPEKLPAPDEYGYFFHPDIHGECVYAVLAAVDCVLRTSEDDEE